MLATTSGVSLDGIEGLDVRIEVDISFGLPVFNVVGLPETAVRESRDRIKSGIRNSGYSFPLDRITVNLAPADVRKAGTGLDLPMAVGILAATGLVPLEAADGTCLLGELSLDGRLQPVAGALSAVLCAKERGFRRIVVPEGNRDETGIVHGIDVFPAVGLSAVVDFLAGVRPLSVHTVDPASVMSPDGGGSHADFRDIAGQKHARRALEVAAAGGHNLLMTGPPGSGKTLLARCLPSILPPMTLDEAIASTRIHSAAGLLRENGRLITSRPFRAPHHTVTRAGLAGGGQRPVPGEISLAHNGLLFLDELPEFRRSVLEVLRQPMEDGVVTLSRSGGSLSFPADFMLIAAMNPCPCGFFGSPTRACTCPSFRVDQYRSRLSGPLLDRIDIHIDVPAVAFQDLAGTGTRSGEASARIRSRVLEARKRQADRFNGLGIAGNARMGVAEIRRFCRLSAGAEGLLETAVTRLGFSARAYHRSLKLARTLADLDQSEDIRTRHVAEAIQYRTPDRSG